MVPEEETAMTKEELKKIREFAEKNFSADENMQLAVDVTTPEGEPVALTNPWIDRSGRFPLTDAQAVHEWGLHNVVTFMKCVEESCAVRL